MSKKTHLDKIVLMAKMGDKNSFNQIRTMFSDLCEVLYKNACTKYPILLSKKYFIYHEYYIAFWDIINEYDFNKGDNFGTILFKNIIKKIYKVAEREENEEEAKSLRLSFRKEQIKENRLYVMQLFKRMTPRQKRKIYRRLYMFPNATADMIGDFLGDKWFNKRFGDIYKRINKKMIPAERNGKIIERTYRLKETRIGG